MIPVISTHFRFHQTGRITAMIFISIQIRAIRSRLIRPMYRTKTHAAHTFANLHIKNRKEPLLTI